jgi:hypothetical protein
VQSTVAARSTLAWLAAVSSFLDAMQLVVVHICMRQLCYGRVVQLICMMIFASALQVGEICEGRSITNRPNSIKVGQQKGHVVYLAESETEMVEWLSALEATVARLIKVIAGVEDPPPSQDVHADSAFSSATHSNASFLKQVESDFEASRPATERRQSAHAPPHIGHYTSKSNYPGIAPPTFVQHANEYETHGSRGEGRAVYRDDHGVSYGMGTGTTIGGVFSVSLMVARVILTP